MKIALNASCSLLMIILATSCDKAGRLRAEQIEVEKKRGQVQDQIRQLEERFRSLGPNGMSSVSPIEKQASQMNDKATAMEAQSTALHRKWNAIDQSMNDLRPKIDAWKAKNLR